MSGLKAGIIGLGVGEQHIAGYENYPGCEVVALCDFSEEKCAMAGAKYPHLNIYENDRAILEDPDIDIVSIASYDNYHYDQIACAIENDKHIFVEKPLCLYAEQARDIRSLLAAKPNLRMSSNLILRKSERFIQLKKMIDAGELGDVYYAEADYNYGRLHKITEGWRGEIDFYSVVYGGGVHVIDLLLWLIGEKVTEVCAFGNNISSKGSQYKYDDAIVSILKFESGVTGKVSCNYSCVYPHFHNMMIYGTEGTFVNDLGKAKLFTSRDPDAKVKEINTAYPGVHKGDLIYSFVDSIVNGGDPDVTEEDVFNAMSVCFAIEKSLQQGSSVEVEYFKDCLRKTQPC